MTDAWFNKKKKDTVKIVKKKLLPHTDTWTSATECLSVHLPPLCEAPPAPLCQAPPAPSEVQKQITKTTKPHLAVHNTGILCVRCSGSNISEFPHSVYHNVEHISHDLNIPEPCMLPFSAGIIYRYIYIYLNTNIIYKYIVYKYTSVILCIYNYIYI